MKNKLKQPSIIDQFKKGSGGKMDSVQTAVNITKVQHAFLSDNELNLSKIVRDRINELIEQTNISKKRG